MQNNNNTLNLKSLGYVVLRTKVNDEEIAKVLSSCEELYEDDKFRDVFSGFTDGTHSDPGITIPDKKRKMYVLSKNEFDLVMRRDAPRITRSGGREKLAMNLRPLYKQCLMAARTIDTRYVINHIVILCSEKGGVDQCVHADKGDKCTHPDFVPLNGIQATALYALENSTALNFQRKDSPAVYRKSINRNNLCVIHGAKMHGGVGYQTRNFRVHLDLGYDKKKCFSAEEVVVVGKKCPNEGCPTYFPDGEDKTYQSHVYQCRYTTDSTARLRINRAKRNKSNKRRKNTVRASKDGKKAKTVQYETYQKWIRNGAQVKLIPNL